MEVINSILYYFNIIKLLLFATTKENIIKIVSFKLALLQLAASCVKFISSLNW
jgi:hypothetical protein